VDFGTATTLDAVTAKGEYLGGAICPGVTISADALFLRAARLPKVEVRKPPTVIGRTTVSSMQSGLFFGYVDMIEGIVRRMRAELGEPQARCIATGGVAGAITAEAVLTLQNDEDRSFSITSWRTGPPRPRTTCWPGPASRDSPPTTAKGCSRTRRARTPAILDPFSRDG